MLIRYLKPFLLLCILATTFACYLPGLTGHFIFDDSVNIGKNTHLKIDALDIPSLWQAASSGTAGPLKRPISMLSFAVNYYVAGMDAYYFKLTNLGIHLINGILIFMFSKLLLNLHLRINKTTASNDNAAFWTALAIATIWLLHPFNLTGVLYVVQRMTSLAALFTLIGLVLYLYGRKQLLDGSKSGFIAIAAAIFVATPLAVLSKENGALLPLLIFAIEMILLRWNSTSQSTRRMLVALVGFSAVVPILLGIFYIINNPGLILGGYMVRDFSLAERLMTEARVLWFYLHMIVMPSMGELGLHHDDIEISRSLFLPWTTLPAIFGLLLLAGGAWVLRNKQPIITFGIAFYLIGHMMESTIIPLEMAFEHRNYLPMLGILLPLAYYALNPGIHLPSLRLRRISFLVMIILFTSLTVSRAQQWGDSLMMRMMEVERHPHSVRANTDIAGLYDHMPPLSSEDAVDLYNKAVFHYQQAADVAPANTSGLFGLLVVNAERGIPINPELIELLEHRLATVPLGSPNLNSIIGTARCIAEGDCSVNQNITNRIYRAALSNPTLTIRNKNLLISEFSQLPLEVQPRIKM